MDSFSLTISVLVAALTALQLYRRSKVIIKAKNTVIEKTSLGISVGLVLVVTVFGASQPFHYVVAALLALLVYTSFLKTGITESGLSSMNRILTTLPWRSIRFAKLVKRVNGEEFVLHSIGKLWANAMAFPMKDFDQTVTLLQKNLGKDRFEVTDEEIVEGLRDAQRKGQGKE